MNRENNPADFDSANDAGGAGDTLRPMEALDSDNVRNADGDEVVDPPRDWSEPMKSEMAEGGETLDDKLAAERPDLGRSPEGPQVGPAEDDVELRPDDEMDHLVGRDTGRDTEQVSGTPEDGESYYPVVE